MSPNDSRGGNDGVSDGADHGEFVFGEERRGGLEGEPEPEPAAGDDSGSGWLAAVGSADRGVLAVAAVFALVVVLALGYAALPATTDGASTDQPTNANATATTDRTATPTSPTAATTTRATTTTAIATPTTPVTTAETVRTGTGSTTDPSATDEAASASSPPNAASTSTPATEPATEARTTNGSNGDVETRAGEPSPVIETFRVERRDAARDVDGAGTATIEAVWTVTDPNGDLESVTVTLVAVDDTGDPRVVDERTFAVHGSKRHAHPVFTVHKSAAAYEVRIEATDAAGNEVVLVERVASSDPLSDD